MPCVQPDLQLFTVQGYPYTVPTIPFLPFPFPSPPSSPDVSACRVPPSSAKPWLMLKPLSLCLCLAVPSVKFRCFHWETVKLSARLCSFGFRVCFFFFTHWNAFGMLRQKKKNPLLVRLPFWFGFSLLCYVPELKQTKPCSVFYHYLPVNAILVLSGFSS